MRALSLLLAAGLTALSSGCDARASHAAAPLRVNGSTTVNPIAAEAAEALRNEYGLVVHVDTQGGSSGGVALLGAGRIDVGMSSRPLTESDRRRFPDTDFVAHRVGEDAVALVVSRDVRAGGVEALSRDEVRAIYEGRFTNWSELGGPDLRIAFFNKEPGRGTWEVFATWLYGSPDDAPSVSHPEVGGNEETRTKVAGTRGALSQLSWSWADGESVVPLALEVDGERIAPGAESIASGRYPMSRPLYLLTDGRPVGDAKTFVDYVLSAAGQELVRRHGYLALEDVGR